jgi:16S rRNA (cytosine1402-N4)-methyltransferase
MLQECLDGLAIKKDGIYVDVTFGGGGHSREIFKLLSSEGKLISFDQDPDAAKNAWNAPNFHFVAANFAFLKNHLRALGISQVDGILADLAFLLISSMMRNVVFPFVRMSVWICV